MPNSPVRLISNGILAIAFIAALPAQERIVVATSTILDGKGAILKNQQIVIEGSRIQSIGTNSGTVTYDLRGLTVMPGWIDTHIHLTRHFDENHVMAPEGKDKPEVDAVFGAENAWLTLQAGFTTVQSLGSPIDALVRDRINRGALPGPRVLTSLQPITNRSGAPEVLRTLVRRLKNEGADVVKLFAKRNDDAMSEQQIDAVCGEARAVGLRAVAHAIEAPVGKVVIQAGCSAVEHGYNADDEELDLMAHRGVYFDPNFLVLHNYLDQKSSFTYGPEMLNWFARLIRDAADCCRERASATSELCSVPTRWRERSAETRKSSSIVSAKARTARWTPLSAQHRCQPSPWACNNGSGRSGREWRPI